MHFFYLYRPVTATEIILGGLLFAGLEKINSACCGRILICDKGGIILSFITMPPRDRLILAALSDIGGEIALRLFWFHALNQLANHLKAIPRQLPVILHHRINTHG